MSFEPVSLSKTEVGALSERIDWEKVGGLVPAIVQDYQSSQVLMMGYMNPAALEKTGETGQVTFFSRTKELFGRKVKRRATYCNCKTLLGL
ncbi:bifunctional phosphoribosyl-AMP cyclohydrolase/phosphoribosyl-ATP pyrophosphatase protein [Vibrio syngnathi]|uniref:phosphoribosyl-AMP cyclohydrolase n=1 Tax=Vibrio syngnathi TaxID=3034029 RepID=A0AA34TQB1_9VIBR|nr:bifunctional phosphoribosyl-AMP cyclohydrolase/phosphoribosyl-ATP pyrophosphatase protein [Vibrio syngnathi]